MSYCPFNCAMMAPRLIVLREMQREGRKELRRYGADLAKMKLDDAGFGAASERVSELARDLADLSCRISDMEMVMHERAYHGAIAAYDAARSV
jgi:cysteine synthase